MNIQDFAKNFGKNRNLDKKQNTQQAQPQNKVETQFNTKKEVERKLVNAYEKAILVKVEERCWVFYLHASVGYYRGNVSSYDVEGACDLESGVYLCTTEIHHEYRETGRADVFVVKDISAPEVKVFTSVWGQTFGWFDLPELKKELGVGRSAREYADKNREAIDAYLLWQQWNLGEYDNRENAWEDYYNSEAFQTILLGLLTQDILEHQMDMIKFKMFPSVTVFQNSNVDVEITFDKTHPAVRYMPRRKQKTVLETQTKMPESIVPTHSRYSHRGTHSDGMSFFDGRWVRDAEAGWCDPDWTSGD
jgi:hypothetical protein